MCRSRRELSNEYLLAKIGVDTAENEPLEVWGENSMHYSLHSLTAIQGKRKSRKKIGEVVVAILEDPPLGARGEGKSREAASVQARIEGAAEANLHCPLAAQLAEA